MSRFNYNTPAEKEALKQRALTLKPKTNGVFATNSGWEVKRNFGKDELLVSFAGLADLLTDDQVEKVVVETINPVETINTELKIDEDALVNPEATTPAVPEIDKVEPSTEDKVEDQPTKPKKKGGRPAKVK